MQTTILFNQLFSMSVIRLSQNGKSYWIFLFLLYQNMFYLYGIEYQKSFDDVQKALEEKKENNVISGYSFIKCMSEIPSVDELKMKSKHDEMLIILDDLMFIASDDRESFSRLNNFVMEDCHHMNISVIFVSQDLM